MDSRANRKTKSNIKTRLLPLLLVAFVFLGGTSTAEAHTVAMPPSAGKPVRTQIQRHLKATHPGVDTYHEYVDAYRTHLWRWWRQRNAAYHGACITAAKYGEVLYRPYGCAGGTLLRIRNCESGNNYSTNTGNGFYGAYQYDLGTWKAAGGAGRYPNLATPREQDRVTARWIRLGHRGAWPNC